ncbi:mucin-2-like, partial [Uloborus diversus]|uniref:mucin-2-like n=1 Tax=Uloborus diversus TaxID=327109 RepID=UPI002409D939
MVSTFTEPSPTARDQLSSMHPFTKEELNKEITTTEENLRITDTSTTEEQPIDIDTITTTKYPLNVITTEKHRSSVWATTPEEDLISGVVSTDTQEMLINNTFATELPNSLSTSNEQQWNKFETTVTEEELKEASTALESTSSSITESTLTSVPPRESRIENSTMFDYSSSNKVYSTTTSPTTKPVFPDDQVVNYCNGGDGIFPDNKNCSMFVRCFSGSPYFQSCPKGLYYNPTKRSCDFDGECGSEPLVPSSRSLAINCGCENCIYPDADDCARYYVCLNGCAYDMQCNDGLQFNAETLTCDYEEQAACAKSSEECPTPNGYIKDSDNCSRYFHCVGGIAYRKTCEDGRHFNEVTEQCDDPCSAGCDSYACMKASTLQPSPVCEDGDEFYPHPENCNAFYTCFNGRAELAFCTDDEHFSPTARMCQEPCEALCDHSLDCVKTSEGVTESTTEMITAKTDASSYVESTTNFVFTSPILQTTEDETTEESSTSERYLSNDTSTNAVSLTSEVVTTETTFGMTSDIPSEYPLTHSTEQNSVEPTTPSVCGTSDGFYPKPGDCSSFINCTSGIPTEQKCDSQLHFSPRTLRCEYPCFAECDPSLDCSSTEVPDQLFNLCPKKDILPGRECNRYINCTGEKPFTRKCPIGLHFNPTTRVCDWSTSAGCGKSSSYPDVDNYYKCPCETCIIPSMESCAKYHLCIGYVAYTAKCSDGLLLDNILNTCNRASKVKCEEGTKQPTTTPLPSSTVSTTEKATTAAETFKCSTKDGYFQKSDDCGKFIQCANWRPYVMKCPSMLHFSMKTLRCEYPCDAKCDLSLACSNASKPGTADKICACLNCKVKDPESCTNYFECKNGKARRLFCRRGQTFDSERGICDWAHKVKCHSQTCPKMNGLFPHRDNCRKFLHCANGIPYINECHNNWEFDPVALRCSWPSGRCGSTTPQPSTLKPRTKSLKDFDCPKNFGVFRDEENCTRFYHCSHGIAFAKECPEGLAFNPKSQTCDWKKNVKCDSNRYHHQRRCRVYDRHTTCPQSRVNIRHSNCDMFYECSTGSACGKRCPVGLYFNSTTAVCDRPENVQCYKDTNEMYSLRDFAKTCYETGEGYMNDPAMVHCFYRCHHEKVVRGCCPRNAVYNEKKDKCEIQRRKLFFFSTNEVLRSNCQAGICDDRPECPESTCRCIFPSNVDCSVYYQCVNGEPLRHKCSDGLLFNTEKLSCDYSSNVNCSMPVSTSAATSVSDNGITLNITQEFSTVESTVSANVDEQTETASRKSRDITKISTDSSKETTSIETGQTDYNTNFPASSTTILSTTTENIDETTSASEEFTIAQNGTESSSTLVSINVTETSTLTTTYSVTDTSESTIDLKTVAPTTDSSITTTAENVDKTTTVSERIETSINITEPSSVSVSINSTEQILTTDSGDESSEGTTGLKTETAAIGISVLTTRSTSSPTNNSTITENNTNTSTTISEETETLQPISTKVTQNVSSTFIPLSTTFKTYGTDQTITQSDETTTTEVSKITKFSTSNYSEKNTETSEMTDIPTTTTSPTSTFFLSTNASILTTDNLTEITEQPISVTSQNPSIYKSSTLPSSSTENDSTTKTKHNIVNISTVTQVDSTTQTKNEERFEFTCPERFGLYPDPYNCTKFFHCSHFTPYQKDCPSNLHFNAELQVCDWPYRAECDSSTEIVTTTETTSNVPETNNTLTCSCDCCELPVLDDCSSYILCINHEGRKITCDEGLDFNPMTSTCDLKENVECESNIQCPSATGTFSYPHSCTHYLECFNGTKIVKQCPEELNFDSLSENCSRTNCEGIKSSTTKTYFTTLTSETKNITNYGTRSTNLETDVTKGIENTSQSTEAPYTSTTSNTPEVSETTNTVIHSTDKRATNSTEVLITTKSITIYPEERTKTNSPSTAPITTDAISTEDDNETLVPTSQQVTNTHTEIPNVDDATNTTLPDHEITQTETKTKTSTSVTETSQNASMTQSRVSTTETDNSTLFPSTAVTPEINSTEDSTADTENSTSTQGTTFTKLPDRFTETDKSEPTEKSTFSVTELTSKAVSEVNVTMKTTGMSEKDNFTITKIATSKEVLTTDYSGKTSEQGKEEVTDISVSLSTTDSKDISSSSTVTTVTNENTEKPTKLNTDIPETTTRTKVTTITTKEEDEIYSISTKSRDATTKSTEQNDFTQEVTTAQQEEFLCPERFGVFPDPKNCSTFYHCSQWIPNLTLCPSDLHYSPTLKTCDWPSDAGCGSDIHPTTEGQIATTSIPETNKTRECDCDCCELPIIGECRSYVLCIDYTKSIITCEEGLYFNPMTSTCDLEERVTCEADVECPTPSGKFPYPHSCKHYLECMNGTKVVKKCPEASNFDALFGSCSSSTECRSTDISTTIDAGNKYSSTPEITTSADAVSEVVTGKVSNIPESKNTAETGSLEISTTYLTSLEPEIPDNQTTVFDVHSSGNTETTLLTSKILPVTKEVPQSTTTARETDDVTQTKDDYHKPSSVSSERTTDSSVTEEGNDSSTEFSTSISTQKPTTLDPITSSSSTDKDVLTSKATNWMSSMKEITTDAPTSSGTESETSVNDLSTSNTFSTTSETLSSSETNSSNFTSKPITKLSTEST